MADYSKSYGSSDPKNDAKWFTDEIGGEFLIAPIHNPRMRLATLKQVKMEEDNSDKSVYDANLPQIQLICKHILLGWNNVTVDGVQKDYTPEYAVEFMTLYQDPVFKWVMEKAQDVQDALLSRNKKNKKK